MSEPGSSADGEQTRDGSKHSGWGGSTIWSDLRLAAQGGSPAAEQALNDLCRQYWQPIYAYIRSRGHQRSDAEDWTQTFIASFVTPKRLINLDPDKGRFRSFLKVCLDNFLANERERAGAQKRNCGKPLFSLDEALAEESYCATAPGLSPDAAYEKRWALAVIEQALLRLETEEAKEGRRAQFARLHVFLTLDGEDDNYATAGAELGMTRGAVTMAVKRLRENCDKSLHAVIAQTVMHRQVEEELRCLKAALRGK